MSNILNLKGVKLFAIVVLAAVILATFGMIAVQKASASCSITTTLRVGSKGAEVMCLQQALGGLTADGSFGPKTKAAVVAFQVHEGLVADGVFGPMSRAAWMNNQGNAGSFPSGCNSASGFSTTTGAPCSGGGNFPAGCTSAVGFSPTTGAKCDGSGSGSNSGPLSGGAGDISSVTLLGTPNAEAVGEGENDHQVLGFEVEADSGSDISLSSVKVEFDRSVGTEQSGSATQIDRYISGVSIWAGSTKVGSASIDDFTKTSTGVYSKSIALSNAVVKADKKVRFYVAVDGNNSVDSTDMLEQFGVDVTSIRFTDATGAILTNSPSLTAQYFNIESAASASNAKLTLTDSNDPIAKAIQVDDGTDTTDNVPLISFKMKATGSDLWVDEIPVLLTQTTQTGTNTVVSDTASITLTIDGQDFSESTAGGTSACAAATCTVTFDNLDLTLNEGNSYNVVVSADVNGVGSALDSGDTLKADIGSTQRGNIVVTVGDENGDTLGTSATDRVGTVSGDTQGFYNQGITVTPGATTAEFNEGSTSANDSYGTFTIKFSVTAIGQDIFLDKSVAASSSTSSSTDNAHVLITSNSGVTSVFSAGNIVSADSNSDEGTYTYEIQNGQTAKFTLSASSSADPGTFIRAILYALEWNTTDAEGANLYSLDMGVNGSYKTDTVLVND